jgi:hypothetical protein
MAPIDFGSVAGWVTAGGVLSMLGLFFKFLPKWVEAKTAERASDNEFGKQLRDELSSRLNECEKQHRDIQKENNDLKNRVALLEDGDRRKTVALTLLMNEVSRLDPTSDIIIRAKAVLELSINLSSQTDEKMNKALRNLEGKE